MTLRVVHINNTDVQQLIWKNEPVVTFALIDQVHGRPYNTAATAFNRNANRFVEGKHFHRLNDAEIDAFTRSNVLRRNENVHRLTVLAQRGYLMIAKVFDDDLAWHIQEQMSDLYFVAKTEIPKMSTMEIVKTIVDEVITRYQRAVTYEHYKGLSH